MDYSQSAKVVSILEILTIIKTTEKKLLPTSVGSVNSFEKKELSYGADIKQLIAKRLQQQIANTMKQIVKRFLRNNADTMLKIESIFWKKVANMTKPIAFDIQPASASIAPRIPKNTKSIHRN